jgi:hypothetical protein
MQILEIFEFAYEDIIHSKLMILYTQKNSKNENKQEKREDAYSASSHLINKSIK